MKTKTYIDDMKDELYRKISRYLPRRLLYYCVIQAWSLATKNIMIKHRAILHGTWFVITYGMKNEH